MDVMMAIFVLQILLAHQLVAAQTNGRGVSCVDTHPRCSRIVPRGRPGGKGGKLCQGNHGKMWCKKTCMLCDPPYTSNSVTSNNKNSSWPSMATLRPTTHKPTSIAGTQSSTGQPWKICFGTSGKWTCPEGKRVHQVTTTMHSST